MVSTNSFPYLLTMQFSSHHTIILKVKHKLVFPIPLCFSFHSYILYDNLILSTAGGWWTMICPWMALYVHNLKWFISLNVSCFEKLLHCPIQIECSFVFSSSFSWILSKVYIKWNHSFNLDAADQHLFYVAMIENV